MPPKKKSTTSTDTTANGETKFSWTPENDRTLLLLSLGRNIGPADYAKFVDALPAAANFQGVRQRVSKLRGEQREKYEDLGWELTVEIATKMKAPVTPKKRKGSDDAEAEAGADSGSEETPVKAKKPRAKKGEGKKKAAREEAKDDGEGSGDGKEESVVKEVKQEEEAI